MNSETIIKVAKLQKQDSRWNIISTHTFHNRDYVIAANGFFYKKGKRVISTPDKKRNLTVLLKDDNNISVRFKIHQIVAQTFFPNQLKDGYSVDHINRDRLDNSIINLRIVPRHIQCLNRENVNYKYKRVECITNNTIYESCIHAETELSLVRNTVSRVARGERKSIKGYTFKYVV